MRSNAHDDAHITCDGKIESQKRMVEAAIEGVKDQGLSQARSAAEGWEGCGYCVYV